jgi:hypothetical protein
VTSGARVDCQRTSSLFGPFNGSMFQGPTYLSCRRVVAHVTELCDLSQTVRPHSELITRLHCPQISENRF